jgi:6-phosphogluconolactonase
MKFVRIEDFIPVFNIIILGMGDDGHTASIFPGNEKLLQSKKICDHAIHPLSGQKRITMTGKVINNANEIFFLVTGIRKSKIIFDILKNNKNYATFPAAHINASNGRTMWFLDEEAADNLK